MLTLRELLEDRVYREFFVTSPTMPPRHPSTPPRWRLYVQREIRGGWARKEFDTYPQAFKFLKPMLPRVHDASIQSKGIAFPPPVRVVRIKKGGKPLLDNQGKQVLRRIVWQPVLLPEDEPHTWCPYCRRPTVFLWFSKHHAFRGQDISFSPHKRCTICGISERLLLGAR